MQPSRSRPAFTVPTEIMRAWAEALRGELEQWPAVRITRGFGMQLVFRGEVVFAALPGTRMLHAEDAIMLKFQGETPALSRRMAADPHFIGAPARSTRSPKSEGHKWRFFQLRGDADVHAAIEWLAVAYRLAQEPRR